MGMYTGLKVQGIVKPKYKSDIFTFNHLLYGMAWETIATVNPIFKELASKPRCDSIPFGALAYMPDSWEWNNDFDFDSGYWNFTCSLKNYHNEIETFIELVPELFEEDFCCEVYYEEWARSVIYTSENGKLKESEGVLYDEDSEEENL